MKNHIAGDVISFVGKKKDEIETGIIEEAFLSMDKSYQCYWVKGCNDLITEFMLIEESKN